MSDAPALGCAILGSVAAGLHPSIQSAVEAMVHVARVVQPDPAAHQQYQRYYRAYKALVRTEALSVLERCLLIFLLCCMPVGVHRWNDDCWTYCRDRPIPRDTSCRQVKVSHATQHHFGSFMWGMPADCFRMQYHSVSVTWHLLHNHGCLYTSTYHPLS